MSVLGGVLLAYLAFFLLTCRAPYSGDEWGPQWLSCARTVRSAIVCGAALREALRAAPSKTPRTLPRCRGARLTVQPRDGHRRLLRTLSVAAPEKGERRSPALKFALEPVNK